VLDLVVATDFLEAKGPSDAFECLYLGRVLAVRTGEVPVLPPQPSKRTEACLESQRQHWRLHL